MRVFVLAIAALTSLSAAIAFERSPEEIREQRQASIDAILNKDSSDDVAIDRNNCMAGQMPHIVERGRKSGSAITPNASDTCVAALIRTGADSQLLMPYKRIVKEAGGDPSVVAKLPGYIGGAVVEQASKRVSIGNGLVISLDAAIVFDAGFTTAYMKGEKIDQGMPDLQTLKAISESCLDRTQERLGLCYAAGYAHAVRALQGNTVVAD